MEIRGGAEAAANLLGMSVCAAIAFTFWAQRGHPDIAVQLPLLGLLLMALVWLSRQTLPHLNRWDRRLGALSYPLYIGHGMILTALMNMTAQRHWQLYATGMAGSLALALGLNEAVERPMRKLRARVRGMAI
jgi:peptidoglycan/LPS O-acetylase OafA/YrhL